MSPHPEIRRPIQKSAHRESDFQAACCPAGASPTLICSDAPSRLPGPIRDLRDRDDGGQYRARHQLLDAVSEIPLAGFGGLRGRVALAAVSAVFGRERRARRTVRSAASDPMRHGPVHYRVARLGLFLHHRHVAAMAGHDALGDPRLRRCAVDDPEPIAGLRYRRPGRSGKRSAAQRHRALCRRAGRAGGRRRAVAGAGAGLWHPGQHAVLSAAGLVAGERALRTALSARCAPAAPRGARFCRHHTDRARY